MDEKTLAALEKLALSYSVEAKDPKDARSADVVFQIYTQQMAETFRLARLGLWAEQRGVPALKQNLQSSRQLLLDLSASQVDYDLVGDIEIDSDEALAALPKTPSTNEAAAEGM